MQFKEEKFIQLGHFFLERNSLRSRRLEVAGERGNGRARGRHARGARARCEPVFCCAHYLQAPATQARRETEISFITKILAADWLRSHVTITLRDKSRYDLILKINETA